MQILQLDPQGTCSWCQKEKEVVELKVDGGPPFKMCWSDLKKALKLRPLFVPPPDKKKTE